MLRKWMIAPAVGLVALAIPACSPSATNSSGSAGKAGAVAPAANVDVGMPFYEKGEAELFKNSDARESSTIVIPNAIVRMDKKQTVSAEVDGRLEIVGYDLDPNAQIDPNDKNLSTDPNHDYLDKEKKLKPIYYMRLFEGNKVKKGQRLTLINDLEALVQINASNKILVASNAAIVEAKAGAASVERSLVILETPGASGSQVEILNAKATLSRYKENIFTSEREKAKAEGDQERATALRDRHRSTAKMDGKIVRIMAQPGEYVRAGQPIMEIISQDDARIEGTLNAADAQRVKDGTLVEIELTQPVGPDHLIGNLSHGKDVTGIAVTANKERPLVVSASLDQTAAVWDIKAPAGSRNQWRLEHSAPVRSVAVTGEKVSNALAATGGDDGKIRFWDVSGPERIGSRPATAECTEAHTSAVTSLSFCPNGRYLVSAAGREMIVWTVADGKKVYMLPSEHKDIITMVRFTPQGKLVTASRDKTVRIWSIGQNTASVDRVIDHRKANLDVLGISSKGGRMLFDKEDGLLEILNLADGTPLGRIQNPVRGARFSAFGVFSPEDTYLLTANSDGDMRGELQVWKTPESKDGRAAEVRRLVTPDDKQPTCAAFGGKPGDGFIVVGTQAGSIHVWSEEMLKGMTKKRSGVVIATQREDSKTFRVTVATSELQDETGQADKSSATLIIRVGTAPATPRPAPGPGNAGAMPVPQLIVPAGGIEASRR